jgi:hypothetical protein
MASFQERVLGALKLQASTYEEVENDASATSQAATIVVAGSALRGIATAISTAMLGLGFGIVGLVVGVVFAVIGWAIGSWVLLMVGTKIMPGKNTQADLGQLLRVTGFASSPSLLSILGVIPILNILLFLAIAVWQIIAMVIGVKQALDYEDTMKAVIVVIIAWVIMFVVTMIAGLIVGTGAGLAGRMM